MINTIDLSFDLYFCVTILEYLFLVNIMRIETIGDLWILDSLDDLLRLLMDTIGMVHTRVQLMRDLVIFLSHVVWSGICSCNQGLVHRLTDFLSIFKDNTFFGTFSFIGSFLASLIEFSDELTSWLNSLYLGLLYQILLQGTFSECLLLC